MLPRFRRKPSSFGAATFLRRAANVQYVVQSGRMLLLDMRDERYYGLDDVGASVWIALGEGIFWLDLLIRIGREYDAPEDALRTDLEAYLRHLRRHRLVEVTQ